MKKAYQSVTLPVRTLRTRFDWRSVLLVVFWLGMLAMTAAFGFIVPMVEEWLIVVALIALLIGIAFTIYLVSNLHIGFYLLFPGALFFPLEIGTGSQTGLNLAVLMILYMFGLWVFKMIVVDKKIEIFLSRPLLPLILFMASITFSFFVGQFRWFPTNGAPLRAQLGGLGIFYLSGFAFIIFSQLVPNLRILKRIHWIFLVSGSLFLLILLVLTFVPTSVAQSVIRFIPISAGGSMLWVWIATFLFSQLFFNRSLNLFMRLALAGIMLAFFYLRFIDGLAWTSGWLPAFVAIVTVLLIGAPRYGIALGILGAIGMLLNWALVSDQVMGGGNVYSLGTRTEAWLVLGKIIMVNPFTGFGPANYYWYTHLHSILGYFVPFNSHNNYVDIIAQSGLIGMSFYLWFLVEVGRLGYSLYLKLPAGFAKIFTLSCIGGLAGVVVGGMFGDWVLPFVYNIRLAGFRASMLPWLFFGGLVVIERSLKDGSFENI